MGGEAGEAEGPPVGVPDREHHPGPEVCVRAPVRGEVREARGDDLFSRVAEPVEVLHQHGVTDRSKPHAEAAGDLFIQAAVGEGRAAGIGALDIPEAGFEELAGCRQQAFDAVIPDRPRAVPLFRDEGMVPDGGPPFARGLISAGDA